MDATRGETGERWYRIWDVYLGVGYLVALVMLANQSEASVTGRAGSAVTLSLIALWYLGFGRRNIRRAAAGRPAWIFVAGLVVLFVVAVCFLRMNSLALLAVCPLVFVSLPLARATPIVAVLNLLPPVIGAIEDESVGTLRRLLPAALLGLAFSVLLGTYIDRIAMQSAERARLIQDLEDSRAEVARLSHQAGVAAERARLAAEIHDTLAQGFTSIVTLVQAAESELGRDDAQVRRRLDLAARTARENLREARALVAALAPSALDSGPLDDAVRRLVERAGEEFGVAAEFATDGEHRQLPTAVEVVVLRAAQEALTNVRKHAEAHQVAVRLTYRDSSVRLLVRDDGRGFVHSGRDGGFGLPGMRKRVEQVGGELSVNSAVGEGTEVRLEVPLCAAA